MPIFEVAMRSTTSRGKSRLPTLSFGISQLANQKNWGMAGEYNGCRGDLVKLRLTLGQTSSLFVTDASRRFISSLTSCRELGLASLVPVRLRVE